VLGILAVQALVSIAIIRYFLTSAKSDFHWWTTLVAPLIGFAAMAVACVLLVVNRGDLSGAADAVYIEILPWVVLAIFVIGMAVAAALRSSAPDRYARIGQFELTDSPDPHRSTDTTGAPA
jgi:di/tricarboxylate transporter